LLPDSYRLPALLRTFTVWFGLCYVLHVYCRRLVYAFLRSLVARLPFVPHPAALVTLVTCGTATGEDFTARFAFIYVSPVWFARFTDSTTAYVTFTAFHHVAVAVAGYCVWFAAVTGLPFVPACCVSVTTRYLHLCCGLPRLLPALRAVYARSAFCVWFGSPFYVTAFAALTGCYRYCRSCAARLVFVRVCCLPIVYTRWTRFVYRRLRSFDCRFTYHLLPFCYRIAVVTLFHC